MGLKKLKELEQGSLVVFHSEKNICSRCHQSYPDNLTYFPLLDTRLELLRDLGIDPYQCANCIRKGVARTAPPRPIYGDNVQKYITDMKSGVAIALIAAALLSLLTLLFVVLVGGYRTWVEPVGIAATVFAVVVIVEAFLYIMN